MIPVSVLITTYNEEKNLLRCLKALKDFDEIIVIDSYSQDKTLEIARQHGVRVENFQWNGQYPKKRQWCLENIKIKHDFVFFVDADEVVRNEIIDKIKTLDFSCAGYFVKGQYVFRDKILEHGLCNNKLVLFDKNKMMFPVINDLDIEGMGEIEGHYQPVLKPDCKGEEIGQLQSSLLHYAYDNQQAWEARHERYAKWEAQMIKRKAYPKDPKPWREAIKNIFRYLPFRGVIAFMHCYVLKRGFSDGKAGFDFALSRYHYYSLVAKFLSRQ